MMVIDNRYTFGDIVYLKTDPEQSPRMVTQIRVSPDGLYYDVSMGTIQSSHYDCELSLEPNIVLKTS